jgi:reverse gyrase
MDILSQIVLSATSFYHSTFFFVVRFFLGIYVAVLFVDLVLIIFLKGFGSDLRVIVKGMDMPVSSKNVMLKKWNKIKSRLQGENVSQYKVAILEADLFVDKVLSDMGYKGKNLSERMEKINPIQLHNYEELKNVHQIRNRIIHEADFSLNKKQAEEAVGIYEALLKNLELL